MQTDCHCSHGSKRWKRPEASSVSAAGAIGIDSAGLWNGRRSDWQTVWIRWTVDCCRKGLRCADAVAVVVAGGLVGIESVAAAAVAAATLAAIRVADEERQLTSWPLLRQRQRCWTILWYRNWLRLHPPSHHRPAREFGPSHLADAGVWREGWRIVLFGSRQ